MDKFTYASLDLCSSCVNMISRNLRSLQWADKLLYISTNTKILKSSVTHCHQSSHLLRTSPVVKLEWYKQALEIPLLTSKIHTQSSSIAFCERFYSIYSRRTKASYPAFDEKNDDLLLRANHSSNCSVRFYTTNTPESEQPASKKSRVYEFDSPISWKSLLILAGVGCFIVFGIQHFKREKDLARKKIRSLGTSKLGGDWTLTDHFGNRRSSTDFRGQWLFIYFGFTHCPDICPEEMQKIVNLINKTDANEKLPKIQPIIITVDPERDTPEALKEYCAEFSPRLLGFTGSPEEIQQATRAYRVYFSPGPKDDDNDYIVDHSIISYLVNPQGEFVEYFGQNKMVDDMYNAIQFHISSYLRREKSEQTKTA